MTELISFNFPTLSKTRLHHVPRRYEETKPVVIQNFTHQRILGIGNNVHRQSLQKLEDEKRFIIEQTELEIWKQAEFRQAEAIQKVKNEAKFEVELAVKKVLKEQEHKIKEEALKVEMAMQKLAIEQIKTERANGEKLLKAAVEKNEEKCAKQLKQAVEVAKDQERRTSEIEATKSARKYAQELEDIKTKALQEKDEAIQTIIQQKDQERIKAVQEAIDQEVVKANKHISQLMIQNQQEIEKIEKVILDKNSVIDELQKEIVKVETVKSKLKKSLLEIRQEFQTFIDRMKFFDDGQSDYLLPSLYLDEFES
ncbi:chromosome partition protein Smc [Patella vulgata]|uniref:chromosome partition protein Smc n=1 Tax=Patella vulgata TaxID=6465 RepID=UPI00217F93C2|nr:chromosome partition protein Smc [Patella vulgata]